MALDLSPYDPQNAETPASSAKVRNSHRTIETFVNDLPIANLHGYPADSTKFLDGSGNWSVPSTGGFVTSLPGSPSNGAVCVYEADSTNRIYWHLIYKSSISKWVKIGGPPLYHEVTTLQNLAAGAYADLGTVGPTITVPLAGSYMVTARALASNANADARSVIGISLAGAAPTASAETYGSSGNGSTSGTEFDLNVLLPPQVLAATNVVKVQYKSFAANGYFLNRRLFVDPVYVS